MFVANPKKPPQIESILRRNKDKLLQFLKNFHNDKDGTSPPPFRRSTRVNFFLQTNSSATRNNSLSSRYKVFSVFRSRATGRSCLYLSPRTCIGHPRVSIHILALSIIILTYLFEYCFHVPSYILSSFSTYSHLPQYRPHPSSRYSLYCSVVSWYVDRPPCPCHARSVPPVQCFLT